MVLHLISKESAIVVKITRVTSELNSTLNFLGTFAENTNYFDTKNVTLDMHLSANEPKWFPNFLHRPPLHF